MPRDVTALTVWTAVANPTDQEIFDEVTAPAAAETPAPTGQGEPAPPVDDGGVPRDAQGRFKPRTQPADRLEGRTAEEAASASGLTDAQLDQEIGRQAGGGNQQQRPPLSELIDERFRRQRAEDERDRAVQMLQERDRRDLAARQAAQQRRTMPDLISDPDGFAEYIRQDTESRGTEIERAVQRRLVDMTFEDAAEQFGEEFENAFQALRGEIAEGDSRMRDRIVNAPNPGKALMRWHRERAAMQEVGGDLAGYRERVLADALKDPEFRQSFADQLRGEATGGNGSGRSTVIGLPSLNRATGSGSAARENTRWESDRELFNNTVRRR